MRLNSLMNMKLQAAALKEYLRKIVLPGPAYAKKDKYLMSYKAIRLRKSRNKTARKSRGVNTRLRRLKFHATTGR